VSTGSNSEATTDLTARLLRGEPAALARAITEVENETTEMSAILRATQPRLGKATIVGFTGAPGAGKSTLISAYIKVLRARDKTVGVVTVDPSSPFSRGAILGDRIRMAEHTTDLGVFVRSVAARGHLGGISRTTARIVDIFDAVGKDVVIVETVGAGQSEVAVAEIADIKVVVCAPGLGDDVQAIKAGLLEIADILVVNKHDLPSADTTIRSLKAMLDLRNNNRDAVQVLATVATTGVGVNELAETIESKCTMHRPTRSPRTRIRRVLAGIAGQIVETHLQDTDDSAIDAVCDAVQRGDLSFESAAQRLLAERLGR